MLIDQVKHIVWALYRTGQQVVLLASSAAVAMFTTADFGVRREVKAEVEQLGLFVVRLAVLAEVVAYCFYARKLAQLGDLLHKPHERVEGVVDDEWHFIENASDCNLGRAIDDVIGVHDLPPIIG